MSSRIVQESVRVKSSGGGETAGHLQCEYLDESSRRKKAVQAAAILGGLALVSLFIPIAHFFLVPGFIIAAIWAYLFFSKQSGTLKESQVTCPSCEKTIRVPSGPLNFPIQQACDSCRMLVTIERVDQKAA